MALKRKTAPAVSPVSLAEARQQCRIDHQDDDGLLQLYIDAAVSHMDGWAGVLGRCLIEQTWELVYDAFPCDGLQIPLGNLMAVDKIEYAHPATGVMTEWASANYGVDAVSIEGWVKPVDAWPDAMDTMNAVRVTYRAGYGAAASDVPAAIRHAILLLVGQAYMVRENAVDGKSFEELPFAVKHLLAPFRRVGF